jgi:hypothetical protein
MFLGTPMMNSQLRIEMISTKTVMIVIEGLVMIGWFFFAQQNLELIISEIVTEIGIEIVTETEIVEIEIETVTETVIETEIAETEIVETETVTDAINEKAGAQAQGRKKRSLGKTILKTLLPLQNCCNEREEIFIYFSSSPPFFCQRKISSHTPFLLLFQASLFSSSIPMSEDPVVVTYHVS